MFIPSITSHTGAIPPDELNLVREIKEMAEERFAIARLFPYGRLPLESDLTPEIAKRLDQNTAHAELIFDELQGLPRDRFLFVMGLLMVILASGSEGSLKKSR